MSMCATCSGLGCSSPIPSLLNKPCAACGGTGEERSCANCANQCMDMDMDPYCAAVNEPWGQVLYRGKPGECGPENKLWKKDERRA